MIRRYTVIILMNNVKTQIIKTRKWITFKSLLPPPHPGSPLPHSCYHSLPEVVFPPPLLSPSSVRLSRCPQPSPRRESTCLYWPHCRVVGLYLQSWLLFRRICTIIEKVTCKNSNETREIAVLDFIFQYRAYNFLIIGVHRESFIPFKCITRSDGMTEQMRIVQTGTEQHYLLCSAAVRPQGSLAIHH